MRHLIKIPPGCSKQIPPVGDLSEDPGHTGETISPSWPAKISGSLGEGSLGFPA